MKFENKIFIEDFKDFEIRGWISSEEFIEKDFNEIAYSLKVKANDVEVVSGIACLLRDDLLGIPELRYGRGFNIKIPSYELSRVLEDNNDNVKFEVISIDTKFIESSLLIEKKIILEDVFNLINEDVNSCLQILPFISIHSIDYLKDNQLIFITKTLYDANLSEVFSDEHRKLIQSINDRYDSFNEENKTNLSIIINKNIFLNVYLSSLKDPIDFNSTFLNLVLEKLKSLPYYAVIDLANQSASEELQQYIYHNLYLPEFNKFELIKALPQNSVELLSLWEDRSLEDKVSLWPLVVNALQYLNRFEDIKYVYLDPIHFVSTEEKQLDDKLSIISKCTSKPDNNWFVLSFVLQELYQNANTNICSELLKIACWEIWKGKYFNIETFCHIFNSILIQTEENIDIEVISNLTDSFQNLVQYYIHDNINFLYNSQLIDSFVNLFNLCNRYGIKSILPVESIVRPYYGLLYEYISKIDFNYLNLDGLNTDTLNIYFRFKTIVNFLNDFNSNNDVSFDHLFGIILELLDLKKKHNILCDKHILTLSRYIQLNSIDDDKKELLVGVHREIKDFYTAYILEPNIESKLKIGIELTTNPPYSKVDTCKWFERVIDARLQQDTNKTLVLIRDLQQFLIDRFRVYGSFDEQLFDLLLSEYLWVVFNTNKCNSIDLLLVEIETELGLSEKHKQKIEEVRLAVILTRVEEGKAFRRIIDLYDGETSLIIKLLERYNFKLSDLQDVEKTNFFKLKLRHFHLFPYTKVLIYSCNKYIPTRQQIIRDTWLHDLIKCGIDYSFVIGGFEANELDDDYMKLQVPDTYEELPRKSLEMFQYAYSSSNHKFYYKLDDDCILNVRAMFGNPHYIKHDYYGRIVRRPLGGVDRKWHQVKSSTEIAKNSLDLSPENSVYCDGSTGYILSRNAIKDLKMILSSRKAQNLIETSYFEDKLLGDLMSIAHVKLSEEGYNTLVKRNTANGRDVQIWEYNILPFGQSNVAVIHTEDDDYRKSYSFDTPPEDKLIFRDITSNGKPEWEVETDSRKPVLEKISVDEKAIGESRVVAIIVSKNEEEFLPNLLDHHRNIGIQHFLYVDNLSSDDSLNYMLEQDDVSVFIASQDYKESRFAVSWQETLCQHYGLGRWVLILDSDELYVYDNFENNKIDKLLDLADSEGANAILAPMIDFYPQGDLAKADITQNQLFYETCNCFDILESMEVFNDKRYGPFSNSVVYSGGLRDRVFGSYNPYPQPNYLNQKYNLIKYTPEMSFIEGLHFIFGHKLFSKRAGIMHFKYHSLFSDKVKREIASGQHWNNGQEYRRYQSILESEQDLVLYDEKISCIFSSSDSLLKNNYISKLF